MIEFLDAILGKYPASGTVDSAHFTELRSMRGGQVLQDFIPSDKHDVLAEAALKRDADGWDCYFGVLPRMRASGRAEDCVLGVNVLWADIDNKTVGGTHLAALMRVGALNLTPSIIVDSGNGIHAYWLLGHLAPFARVKPLMQGLQSAIGSDHVHDAPRVLRLPGTHNHKGCRHALQYDDHIGGYPTEVETPFVFACKPVRLLHFEPERRYRLSDFDDFMPEEPRYRLYEDVRGPVDGWEPSRNAPPFPEGTRNASLARLAGIMVARGMTPIDMLAALLDENNRRCVPPLPAAEVERIVRSVGRYR